MWWLCSDEREVSSPGLAPKVMGVNVFLGWYQPNKHVTPEQTLDQALERYEEKFGSQPEVALVNNDWLQALTDANKIRVEAAPYIPARTIYVGFYDTPEGRSEYVSAG